VNYKTNYATFLENLSLFVGSNANQMNVSNLYVFLDDMTYFGYTYNTAPEKVNSIMQYFGTTQIYLHIYASRIHGEIIKIYNYSKSAGSICPNNLNDFDLKVYRYASPHSIIETLNQLAANQDKYAEYTLYISSYLFQEEVYGMKNATGPNDSTARIAMFQDVARAIRKDTSPDIKTRNDIADMCAIFPCIMFEICMNNIQKSCANNCDYILRSDPGNQLCRAATIRPDKTPRKIVVLNNSRIVNINAIQPNQTSS
jgi:hypothetical protein